MSSEFNKGASYHGSDKVKGGKLTGHTGKSDYFFFTCPTCKQKDRRMLVLDCGVHSKANDTKGQVTVFKLRCDLCNLVDFTKIEVDKRFDPSTDWIDSN